MARLQYDDIFYSICPHCKRNVGKFYKAIHYEVEFINGYPAPCRFNGMRNIDIDTAQKVARKLGFETEYPVLD